MLYADDAVMTLRYRPSSFGWEVDYSNLSEDPGERTPQKGASPDFHHNRVDDEPGSSTAGQTLNQPLSGSNMEKKKEVRLVVGPDLVRCQRFKSWLEVFCRYKHTNVHSHKHPQVHTDTAI